MAVIFIAMAGALLTSIYLYSLARKSEHYLAVRLFAALILVGIGVIAQKVHSQGGWPW